MSRPIILVSGVVLIAAITLFFYCGSTSRNRVTNIPGSADIANQTTSISLGNGYVLQQLPYDWRLEERQDNVVNTVKFGSPAVIVTLQPKTPSDRLSGPVISLQTFTIDARLAARDIVNLIQDRSTADKVDRANEPCLLKSTLFSSADIDNYEYTQDTSGRYDCSFEVTEPSISHTLVIRERSSNVALLATLTVTDQIEYDSSINIFAQVIDDIRTE